MRPRSSICEIYSFPKVYAEGVRLHSPGSPDFSGYPGLTSPLAASTLQKSPSIAVGGVEDHVHIACRLGKTLDVSALIKALKQGSSIWIKSEFKNQQLFHWQNGDGAFSVSPSHVPALKEYIHNQEEHHRHESFQDEFRRRLKIYEVGYDERYV